MRIFCNADLTLINTCTLSNLFVQEAFRLATANTKLNKFE